MYSVYKVDYRGAAAPKKTLALVFVIVMYFEVACKMALYIGCHCPTMIKYIDGALYRVS